MKSDYFYKANQILKREGFYVLARKAGLKLAHFLMAGQCGGMVSKEINRELDLIAKQCKDIIKERRGSERDNAVYDALKTSAPWYQRIVIPGKNISTTDEEIWAVFDDAPDNRLAGRLSPSEAAILRPLPKWLFIKNRLPEIKGKSILEIGSNCGFFTFEFAKLGAEIAIGIEAIPQYFKQASLMKQLSGIKNARFLNQDFLFSDESQEYDMIFSSTVLGHMIFPFLGIYKMLKRAREFVLLDIDMMPAAFALCGLELCNDNKYHFFNFTDKMITDFLYRCGIKEEAIKKHFYADRCLYVIDVSFSDIDAVLSVDNDPLWSGILHVA